MFKKIADLISRDEWIGRCERYRCLDDRDRLLDGTFYSHLRNAFYDEREQGGAIIPITERRPSAQYRLPRMVARWSARKLFAGRNVPKLRHTDKKLEKRVAAMMRRAKLWATMSAAVLNGSVGSVAITFRVDGEGPDARIAFNVWRAKYCQPSFDNMGDLAQLRVAYVTTGVALKALGAPGVEEGKMYWFVRDYLPASEVTYIPEQKEDWNPQDGFRDQTKSLRKWDAQEVKHDLGYVPGVWVVNLSGGQAPDGVCTFEDAIPNSIELDYTLSQVGRGTRYNCAPQLVTIGDVITGGGDVTRGPMTQLGMRAGYKGEDGEMYGAGDAKLLEMSGQGTTAALELIRMLRNLALEQISGSRKDPDKMKAPLSGRAMEFLEEEPFDLVGDLRDQYGEYGLLPLVKKVLDACGIAEAGDLTLQWPRMVQPTPDELFSLAQALQLLLDPMKLSTPPQAGKPGKSAGATGSATPPTPPAPAQAPGEDNQILTIAEARAYVAQVLDLTMLDVDGSEEAPGDVDESPTPPNEPTPPVPPPVDDPPVDPVEGAESSADRDAGGDPGGEVVTINA